MAAGSLAGVALTEGTDCGLGSAGSGTELDGATTAIIAVAASAAGAAAGAALLKLKKIVQKIKGMFGIPGGKTKNPFKKLKMLDVLKKGIISMKAIKLLQVKKVLTVGKLMKGLAKGPLLVGLLLILQGDSSSFGEMISQLTEFVTNSIGGTTTGDDNDGNDNGDGEHAVKSRIQEVLLAGNTDQALNRIINVLDARVRSVIQ